MVGIGGKRPFVPSLGIVVAAELAAGIADQRRDVGIVVVAERPKRGDAGEIIALVINERVGGVVAGESSAQLLLSFFGFLLWLSFFGGVC